MAKNNLLIPVEEAKEIIRTMVHSKSTIKLPIEKATDYVLSANIKSSIDSPPFHQSAMDGFAFRMDDLMSGKTLKVVGEVQAGSVFNRKVMKGEAVRIFTGAPVPAGANTVVMQEKSVLMNDVLAIQDELLKKGSNIRYKGSQLSKNSLAVKKGTLLNPGSIGYLASLGCHEVTVFRKPKVKVIVTGNELIPPGKKLNQGQIFESNSHTLLSVLNKDGINEVKVIRVKDQLNATLEAFRKAMTWADIILFTGGISVGDYDFVGEAMHQEKVNTLFNKIKQKPGKPIYFGKKGAKFIFGLPGNPASVLVCYYEYVRMAIQRFSNFPETESAILNLPLTSEVSKKSGLTYFLKGYTDFKTVTPMDGQESYIMKSFLQANCLIVLNENDIRKKSGDLVQIHLI